MKNYSKVFTLIGTVLALAFCLASCKSNDDDDPTMYTVTVSSSIEHGKVSVDKTSAEAGATIKLTATADDGYELEAFSAKDASENALTVTDDTFTMPKSNVTVSATFKEKSSSGRTTGSGTTSGGTEKQAGSISYATESVKKTTDSTAFTNELTKIGNGTVTYSSSNETVATVNASTGEVTIVGAGTATITATVADSDTYTYAVKTASYTVKILSETLLTTITGTGNKGAATSENISYSTGGVATLTFSGDVLYVSTWGWWGYDITLTVTPADGYTITKCVFYDNKDNNATDSEAPFVAETSGDQKMPKVNGSYIYPYSDSAAVKKIEVYGYDMR